MSQNYARPLTVLAVILLVVAVFALIGWAYSAGQTSRITTTTTSTTTATSTETSEATSTTITASTIISTATITTTTTAYPSTPSSNLTTHYVTLSKAYAFLVSNYNSDKGLISETTGSLTYWLYSDNFLATIALRQVGPLGPYLMAIANNISATIQSYAPGLGNATNQYMVLSSSWKSPCIFGSAGSYTVAQTSNGQINVTLNNSTGTLSDSGYADIAFLTAVCLQNQGNHSEALTALNLGAGFFDGTGFADAPFADSGGQYQTYKLALFIYACRLLSQPVNQAALATLLKMQAPDGGFYTGYYSDLTHGSTMSNTETTSLAILALSG